jgi:hypothetical protein
VKLIHDPLQGPGTEEVPENQSAADMLRDILNQKRQILLSKLTSIDSEVRGSLFYFAAIHTSSNIQKKAPNQMQQSDVKFIASSHRRCSICFGQHHAHHQELFQTAVAASGFRTNAEVDVFPAVVGLLLTNMFRAL